MIRKIKLKLCFINSMKALLINSLLLIGVFSPLLMAGEYKINATNQSDGSVLVNFDLLVEPKLTVIHKGNQDFSYFTNLNGFNRSTTLGMPQILSKQVPLMVKANRDYTVTLVGSSFKVYDLKAPYIVGRGVITRAIDNKRQTDNKRQDSPYVINHLLQQQSQPKPVIGTVERFLIRNVSDRLWQRKDEVEISHR